MKTETLSFLHFLRLLWFRRAVDSLRILPMKSINPFGESREHFGFDEEEEPNQMTFSVKLIEENHTNSNLILYCGLLDGYGECELQQKQQTHSYTHNSCGLLLSRQNFTPYKMVTMKLDT